MTINVDFSPFAELLTLPMLEALWRIFFWYFGWLPIAIVMFWGLSQVWLSRRRHAWEHHQKFILLAIDVPRNNVQSPRAVENMFVYLAGAHGSFTLIDKWWHGKFQLGFSFEIVSIGGYIQFLIHTPVQFRHLVESAVYSQYPDAEIYEVEDYTKLAPAHYPDEEYDIWGSEFIQTGPEILPIRTYPEFEHDFGEPETRFRDPMTSLMDLMSSLKKGEQLWYQIIVIPISQEWVKEADEFTDEILGKPHKPTKANQFVDSTVEWLSDASEKVYELWGHVESHDAKEKAMLKATELPPGPKKKIEAAQQKASKLGFEVSIRGVYFSRKDVMNKPKAVNGFVGYIKQFNTGDLNALKPDTKMTMTSASYFFTKKRISEKKDKIIYAYRNRSDHMGRAPWLLNVEELATLWHFPIDAVTKAPLIQRAAAKRIEPPMALPFDAERKALSKTDPIFDESYTVEDEAQPAEKAPARARRRPGFLEEKETEPAEEAVEDKAADEEFTAPAGDEYPEDSATDVPEATQEVAAREAAAEERGSPPSNLPFA